jgi:hypothetical protein
MTMVAERGRTMPLSGQRLEYFAGSPMFATGVSSPALKLVDTRRAMT